MTRKHFVFAGSAARARKKRTPRAVLGPLAFAFFAATGLAAPTAYGQSADVSTTATIADSILAPGTSSVITLTFRNEGPDVAPLVTAGTLYVGTSGSRTVELFPLPQTPPCVMTFDVFAPPPPTPGFVSVGITASGNIPAGGTRTCAIGVFAAPEARGSYRVSFNTLVSFAMDPNTGNNGSFVDIRFGSSATPVPSLTSTGAAVLASLLVFITAARRAHENARRKLRLPTPSRHLSCTKRPFPPRAR